MIVLLEVAFDVPASSDRPTTDYPNNERFSPRTNLFYWNEPYRRLSHTEHENVFVDASSVVVCMTAPNPPTKQYNLPFTSLNNMSALSAATDKSILCCNYYSAHWIFLLFFHFYFCSGNPRRACWQHHSVSHLMAWKWWNEYVYFIFECVAWWCAELTCRSNNICQRN